jgi:ureidoacrylate peracid hydrolase
VCRGASQQQQKFPNVTQHIRRYLMRAASRLPCAWLCEAARPRATMVTVAARRRRLRQLGRHVAGQQPRAADATSRSKLPHATTTAAAAGAGAFFDTSQVARRQQTLVPERSALLVIDMQNFNLDRARGAEGQILTGPEYEYYWRRSDEVVARQQKLLAAFRAKGVEVIYTTIEALTKDGRDRSIDYKISGFCVPRGSWDGQVLPAVAPVGDEMVLPKGSSSVWMSTNIGYILRSMGINQVVMVGALTDQCVESAVRDACDDNFLVTLVPDACVTMSAERQANSVAAVAVRKPCRRCCCCCCCLL